MKNSIWILICFVICCGCDSTSPMDKNESSSTENAGWTSAKRELSSVKDTVFNLKEEMKQMQEEIVVLQNDVKQQSSKISEFKGSKADKYFWWMVVAIGFCCIKTVLSIILDFKDNSDEELREKVSDLESKLKNKNYHQYNQYNNVNKQTNIDISPLQTELSNLRSSISSIENRINHLEVKHREVETLSDSRVQIYTSRSKGINGQIVYFGNVKGSLFNDVFDSCGDKAKFKAVIVGNEGTFEPIDLNRISSLDNIGNAVKYIGDVQLSTAKGFEIQERGKVHKQEGIWLIDKPVVIQLIK